MDIRRRLYFIVPAALAAALHNVVHESVHYVAARMLGEGVREFRLFTNGWGTSQVIFATPVAERAGAHWLAIAWLPAVATVLIGYLIYGNRHRLMGRWPLVNSALWYGGFFCLCLDPLYYSLLSILLGGDVDAASAVGWSPWPVRVVALAILIANGRLMLGWRREAQANPERYLPART